jgi:DNA-directed RNA polymerase subunit RPC12/RpoP
MATSFRCPNCNAPLDLAKNTNDVSIHCDYCNSTIIVPEELRTGRVNQNQTGQAASLAQVVMYVQQGQKIQAVKQFREAFGVSLKEAKDVVDALERHETLHFGSQTFSSATEISVSDLQSTFPMQTNQKASGGMGCGVLFALLMAGVLGFVIYGALGGLDGVDNPQINQIVEQIDQVIGNVENGDLGSGETAVEQADQQFARQIAEAIAATNPNVTDIDLLTEEIAKSIANGEALPTDFDGVMIQIDPEILAQASQLSGETAVSRDLVTLSIGGEEGIGPGFFNDTRRLDIDGTGNIYTGDYSGGRIQIFDSNGQFLRQLNVGADLYMGGMAVDQQGIIYVAKGSGLEKYSGETGELLGFVTRTEGERFDSVASAVDGSIIAYNDDRLMRFDAQGNVSLDFVDPFVSISDFQTTHNDIAVDGAGNIYILGSETIYKFDSNGQFIDRIGSKGDGEDQFFTSPSAIAVDGRGHIFAQDFSGVKIYDQNGRFLRLLESPGIAFDMVFTTDNQLLLMDRNGNEIRQYKISD